MFVGINQIFAFNSEVESLNTVKSNQNSILLGNVETIEIFSPENRILILTRGEEEFEYLYGFDFGGNLLFKTAPPLHYSFWYLSGKQIACNEADHYAVKSPRSGWWFSIDLDTGVLTMGAPAY